MLKKNVDTLFLGKNYFSLLFAQQVLKKGDSALVVCDPSYQDAGGLSDFLPYLELKLIKEWMESPDKRQWDDENIAPINLDQVADNWPVIFHWDKKILLLGNSPISNLLEILRKFPAMFQESAHFSPDDMIKDCLQFEDEFNQEFMLFCERTARNLFFYTSSLNYQFSKILDDCPSWLRKCFKAFSLQYLYEMGQESNKNWEFLSLVYSLKAFYQKCFSFPTTEMEIFHLLLSMLSPLYKINTEKIEEALSKRVTLLGGQMVDAWVTEWQFDRGRPWAVLLNTFDGMIRPKRIVLSAGGPDTLPFAWEDSGDMYQVFDWVPRNSFFHVESHYREQSGPFVLVVANSKELNCDRTLGIFRFENSGVEGKIFQRYYQGMKVEFIQEELKQFISENLNWPMFFLENKSKFMAQYEFRPKAEFWPSRQLVFPFLKRLGQPPVPKISRPILRQIYGGPEPLRAVTYIGPSWKMTGHTGPLSLVMEIKDSSTLLWP